MGKHAPPCRFLPEQPPSPPARSCPAFVTWQVSRQSSAEARAGLRPEQRLPSRPGASLLRPGHGRDGGLAGSVGPMGKKRKFSPAPAAAQRKVTAGPAVCSAPRPASSQALTARRAASPAASRRTPPPRRARPAIPPRSNTAHVLRRPAPHRGDSPACSLAAPQPSPQAGAALPGAGGNGQ